LIKRVTRSFLAKLKKARSLSYSKRVDRIGRTMKSALSGRQIGLRAFVTLLDWRIVIATFFGNLFFPVVGLFVSWRLY
jgi:putative transposon-encoded protein